ncbi:hypothetical protein WICPIJ_004431 [Wickerhamomyces pijperi]|uniref:Secreted protein n=1 Tax=Wickerhamomyces pijperi TaxID=599730 RepID=A0A9P8Q7P1_WICPI|nr:hypothetical protein WICPIJ_004431 [Wickerhamomyces pijperi]
MVLLVLFVVLEDSVYEQSGEQVPHTGEVRLDDWDLEIVGRDVALAVALGTHSDDGVWELFECQRRDDDVLEAVNVVHLQQGFLQSGHTRDLEINQQFHFELVWGDDVDEPPLQDLFVNRNHRLTDIQRSFVPHHRVKKPQTVRVGLLDICADLARVAENLVVWRVSGQQRLVVDTDLFDPQVQLFDLLQCDLCSSNRTVACVVGEVHRVEHVHIPSLALQWECGGLVPNVAVYHVRLDG